MLTSILNSTLESVPSHSLNMWQARQGRWWIMISQMVLGLVCAELSQNAICSMATRTNLTYWDITELILELESEPNTGDSTDTNFTQWTDNTHCRPTVPAVRKFMESPSELRWTEAPHINRLFPTERFNALLFWNYTTVGGRDKWILSSVPGHTGGRMVPTAWCDTSGNVFVFGSYCADGARSEGHAERLLVDTRTVLHDLLWLTVENESCIWQAQWFIR